MNAGGSRRPLGAMVAVAAMMLGLVVGVPVGLVILAGSPVPASLPSGADVSRALTLGDLDPAFIIKALGAVCWLAWVQLIAALVLESMAVIGKRPSRRMWGVPGVQPLAAAMVAAVLAASTTVRGDTPALRPTPLRAALDGGDANPAPDAPLEPERRGRFEHHPVHPRHVVGGRDTLWSIAEDRLGDGRRWREVFDMNRAPGGPLLRPEDVLGRGWDLVLPPDAAEPETLRHADTSHEVGQAIASLTEATTNAEHLLELAATDGRDALGHLGSESLEPPQVSGAAAGARPPSPMALLQGAGLLAGGVVWTLDRRRRARDRLRVPGDAAPVDIPDPVRQSEIALRSAARGGQLPAVEAAVRRWAASLQESGREPPPVVGINVAEELSILFAGRDPDPIEGFTAEDDGFSWVTPLLPATDLAPSDAPWPLPCVFTTGHTDRSQVLLNVEAVDLIDVVGPAVSVAETMLAAALELATGPWATDVEVITVGFGHEIRALEQVTVASSLDDVIDDIERAQERIEAELGRLDGALTSPTASNLRIHRAADVAPPTVVVCAGHQNQAALDRLHAVATATPGLGVCALVAGPTRWGSWRLEVSDDEVTLHPVGVSLRRHRIPSAARLALADLLDPPTGDALSGLPRPSTLAPTASIGREPDAGGPEVRVLGPVNIEGIDGAFPRRKALELVAYLALHPRGADGDMISEALWPDRVSSPSTFHTTTTLARRVLGVDGSGDLYLPHVTGNGVYRLHANVALDWRRFGELVSRPGESDDEAAIDRLRQALALVRGRPFTVANGEFVWAHAEALVSAATAEVTDAAHELAGRLLDAGDHRGVWWATQQGLLASPGHEQLYRDRMLAAEAAGNPAGIDEVIEELCRTIGVETHQLHDALHPRTVELYERLSRNRPRARTLLSRA